MTRSKIALFSPTLDGGGAERAFLNLARGLAERGESVDLVLRRAQGTYLSQVHPLVRVVDLRSWSLLTSLPTLVSYLRREQPEVLIATMPYTNIAALLAVKIARLRTRLILNEQCHLSEWLNTSTRTKDRLLPWALRLFYPLADTITAASHGVAEDLARLITEAGEVVVIYNPVVTPEIERLANEPIDHPWFEPDAPPVILGVGRLTAQKDFPTLLRAFALVRQRRVARLVVLGEGEDRPELESLVAQLGIEDDVALPGFVDNPYKYMQRASVFALSSIYEGFGNVVAEALAVGTPVVSTDCPSGPAEILRDGRDGALVPVRDATAMANALDATLGSPRNPTLLQCRARDFSIAAVVESYMQVIRPEGIQQQARAIME